MITEHQISHWVRTLGVSGLDKAFQIALPHSVAREVLNAHCARLEDLRRPDSGATSEQMREARQALESVVAATLMQKDSARTPESLYDALAVCTGGSQAERMKRQARNYMRRYAAWMYADTREVPRTEVLAEAQRRRNSVDPAVRAAQLIADDRPLEAQKLMAFYGVSPNEVRDAISTGTTELPGVARTLESIDTHAVYRSVPERPMTTLPDAVRKAVEGLVRDNLLAMRAGCEPLSARGHWQAVRRWYQVELPPKIERLIEQQTADASAWAIWKRAGYK